MPIKNLNKITKKLSKKRGKLNALHENSRNAKVLRRAVGREERISRVATSAVIARQSFCKSIMLGFSKGCTRVSMNDGLLTLATVDRASYFQECLQESSEPLVITDEKIPELIHE